MFFEYLAKVRAQPKGARKRFAFFTSLSITALIALFWLLALFAGRPNDLSESPVSEEITKKSFDFQESVRVFSETFGLDSGAPEVPEQATDTPPLFNLESTFVSPQEATSSMDTQMDTATTTGGESPVDTGEAQAEEEVHVTP